VQSNWDIRVVSHSVEITGNEMGSLGCSNTIHELGIAGWAIGMRESAGGGISIVSLPIDLFGDPILLPRRPVLIPDQSANAADRKDNALAIHRHGSNPPSAYRERTAGSRNLSLCMSRVFHQGFPRNRCRCRNLLSDLPLSAH
jgi:hypothetical protein